MNYLNKCSRVRYMIIASRSHRCTSRASSMIWASPTDCVKASILSSTFVWPCFTETQKFQRSMLRQYSPQMDSLGNNVLFGSLWLRSNASPGKSSANCVGSNYMRCNMLSDPTHIIWVIQTEIMDISAESHALRVVLWYQTQSTPAKAPYLFITFCLVRLRTGPRNVMHSDFKVSGYFIPVLR